MSRPVKYLFAVISIAIAITTTARAQDSMVEVVGGDGAALTELLLRNITPVNSGFTDVHTLRRITVGVMPDDLPFEIPVPDNAQVLGGITDIDMTSIGAELTSRGSIYVNVPGPSNGVHDFYSEALHPASGWHLVVSYPASGFLAFDLPFPMYCSPDNEMVMEFTVIEQNQEVTLVSFYWKETAVLLCETESALRTKIETFFPALERPPGAQIISSQSTNWGNNNRLTHAVMRANVTAEKLAVHYAEQLMSQGWEIINKSYSSMSAASSWTFTHKSGNVWHGVLFVFDEGDNRRSAYFQALLRGPTP